MPYPYPAALIREEDGSGFSVYFPDLPEVAAGGDSVEEALSNAAVGLAVALRDLTERHAPSPRPRLWKRRAPGCGRNGSWTVCPSRMTPCSGMWPPRRLDAFGFQTYIMNRARDAASISRP